MANRYWSKDQISAVKGLVNIFPAIAFNAASAPTLMRYNPNSRTYVSAPSTGADGALSITRNSIGNYSLVLQDKYTRLVSFGVTLIGSANAAAPLVQVKVASDPNNGGSFGTTVADGLGTTFNTINFLVFSAQNTLADPAATELGVCCIQLQNSGAI